MTRPRKTLIDLNTTPYYHCISRCVRRAFLCGEDHLTGRNYEHRKAWVMARLAYLSHTFAIDIASYAVMSNHYHLVLRINANKANQWSEATVIRRWGKLYRIPQLVKDYQRKDMSKSIQAMAQERIEQWRTRLADISWFMRSLNEYLARKANHEDQCTGRFWEGRFKSQALLDDAAVLSAMTYVDLNPIRAKVAKTPETSTFTSIYQRLKAIRKTSKSNSIQLMPLSQSHKQRHPNSVSFSKQDYFELVDWTGRMLREDKRGSISNDLPPILERLNLRPDGFVELIQRQDDIKGLHVIGSPVAMAHYLDTIEKKFLKGMSLSQKLYL